MRHWPSGRASATTLPTHGESVAEMARQVVFDAYGEEAYTRGITVWTTVRKADQEAAYAAVRRGVVDYDRRHGYRGPEAYVNLPPSRPSRSQVLDRVFRKRPDGDNLVVAVVQEAAAERGARRDRAAATSSS